MNQQATTLLLTNPISHDQSLLDLQDLHWLRSIKLHFSVLDTLSMPDWRKMGEVLVAVVPFG